jgi:hypothetical protein
MEIEETATNKTSNLPDGNDTNNNIDKNTNSSIKFSILHNENDLDSSNKMNTDETMANNSDFNGDDIKEFVNKGRTGRRNAVADFNLDPNINTMSTSKLADLMCKSMINNNTAEKHQTSTN